MPNHVYWFESTQHNVAYGTRLTPELYKEMSEWMKTRLNLAVLAPIKYMLRYDSSLRTINIGYINVDPPIFACCQRMRHYTANLAIARGSNFHQGNLLLLKHMDNSFTFGKDRVMKKYLENVRKYSQAYTDDMRLINTQHIYELTNILDEIAAKYHFPEMSNADVLTMVTVGNASRNSTIRLDKLSCDECNMVVENLTTLIKHYSLKQYIMNKRFQCQLCTRSRCTKLDLENHLLEHHKAKNVKGRLINVENSEEIPQKHSTLIELTEEEANEGYDETRIKVVRKDNLGSEQLNQIVAEINDNSIAFHAYTEEGSDDETADAIPPIRIQESDDDNSEAQCTTGNSLDSEPNDYQCNTIDQNLNVDGSIEYPQPENVQIQQQLKKSLLMVDTIDLDLSTDDSRRTIEQIKLVLSRVITKKDESRKQNLTRQLEGSLKIFDSVRPDLSDNAAAEVLNHLKDVLRNAIEEQNTNTETGSSFDSSIETIDIETSTDSIV